MTPEKTSKVLRYVELTLKQARGEKLSPEEDAEVNEIPGELNMTHEELIAEGQTEMHKRYP